MITRSSKENAFFLLSLSLSLSLSMHQRALSLASSLSFRKQKKPCLFWRVVGVVGVGGGVALQLLACWENKKEKNCRKEKRSHETLNNSVHFFYYPD